MRASAAHPLDPERWQWLDGDNYQPQFFSFDESGSGIKAPDFTVNSKKVDYFNYFWNDDIIDQMVEESIRYFYFKQGCRVLAQHLCDHQWYDIDRNEMKVFLSLVMLMGIIKKNNAKLIGVLVLLFRPQSSTKLCL